MTRLDKKQSIFKRFFSNNAYCWLACGCTIGVMMLVYYCYDLFPFGETTILRMDLYHQYGPLFAELYDRVTNLESFLYSWQTGLGSSFLGNFFNYLSSPSMIIMLLLGHENMPEAIAGMIIAKAALAAASFAYYLKKSQGRHDYSTAAFGVLYAMCGYFIAYYWNVMWIDAMVYFPLVILGIENIINRRNPRVYIAFLALTLLSSYYMGFMTCIFSVIYFLVYYFGNQNEPYDLRTPYTLDTNGNKIYKTMDKIKGSIFLRSGFTFAFASVAAAGIVAFALIPTYFILKNCSATSGTFPETYKSYYSIFDFLANHLASVKPTIRSSGEDVLPNVYCGIATVLLVPLYLFTKSIPLKQKVANVALLGIIYFSFNVNILNYIWHGFHYPNDLPYRWSFMYSFILLVLAYKAFVRLHEFSGRQLLGTGVAVLAFIILVQEIGSKNVEEITVLISIIFVVTYCLVFALMKDKKYQQSAVAVLLLCCVIGEVACANTDRYSMDQLKSNYTGDYSDFRALKAELDEHNEGDDMYRMELTCNRARMDPAWYGYNGISTFTSMAYEKMANTQSDLGVYGNYINSYTYYLQTPVYNMMHALKYVVNNDTEVTVENDYYTELMTQGKFTAYQNDYYLPVGFAVNSELKDWYSDLTNPFTVQGDWFEYATGVSDVFGMMKIDDIQYYNMDEITSGLETGDIYYTKSGDGEGELTFVLKTEEIKHCYLYVNSRDFDSIEIIKDDTEFTQSTDEPYIYDLGIVTPEEEVRVNITIEDSEYGYIDFYPYYVNDDALNKGYKILKNRQLNVTSYEETKISGTVSVDNDCLFFTSIPYDSGWTVKIDGIEIAKEDYVALNDAYLCFNLPAGDHSIELSYMPDGLLIGACVSAFTVIALIVAAIFFSKRRKKMALIPVFVPAAPVAENDDEPASVDIEIGEQISEETTDISEEADAKDEIPAETTTEEETAADNTDEEIIEETAEDTVNDTEENE